MEIHYSDLEDVIGLIHLIGSLDIEGVGQIETRFVG